MRGLKGVFGVVAMVAMVCLLFLVGGGVAVAAPSSFGGEGEEAGQFSGPSGVAVEQESGDVYVVDRGNRRLDKFGGAGEFLFASGWGVADGHSAAPQVCTSVCFAGIQEGAGGGQLGRFAEGVAVDNGPLSSSHGDVYVFDIGNNRVEKFDSAGSFLLAFGHEVNATTHGNVCLAGESCQAGTHGTGVGEFATAGFGITVIAVNPVGTVYVGDENRVQEFSPGGVYEGQIALPGVGFILSLAVDSSSDVYVTGTELSGTHKYSSVGAELGEPRGFAKTIALGPSDALFVNNSRGHILEYDASGQEISSLVDERNSLVDEGNDTGLAFSESRQALYVLREKGITVASLLPLGPFVLVGSESASERAPTTATINAVVNPEGHATSYRFEYGTTAAYGASTSQEALSGSAFEDQPVSATLSIATLSELQPRTLYHFRVVATNSAGTAFGTDETFTTLPPALIDSESVSSVTSKGATLAAQLNPLGRDTRYRFEYGTSTAYGTSVPVPDGNAGSGTVDVPLSVLVEGLSPSTTYHYRVVASNTLGTVEGPDQVFTTQGGEAPALPDGRAWEMVSPPDKRGVSLSPMNSKGGVIEASADGGAFAYVAAGPIDAEPQGNRSLAVTQILAARGAGGWSSLDIATPHEAVAGLINSFYAEYRLFSPGLSVGLVQPEGDTPLSPQASERTPYLRETNGEYTPLVTAANVPPGTKFGQLTEGAGDGTNRGAPVPGDAEFVSATPDLSHVILQSAPALTTGIADTEGRENLFEWAGGSLRLVSILPNGKPATEEEGAALGHKSHNVRHAISDDGSRIFWEAVHERVAHLYMRDVSRGETVQVDAPEAGARGGDGSPQFNTASSDGSRVFFTDASRLTTDSTTGGGLYMCKIGEVAGKLACALKDLSVDRNAGESAGVRGTVIGAGEDGAYVYFRARGVLASGAVPGGNNLYMSDTATGETRLVATLADQDTPGPTESFGEENLGYLTSGVSPNGRYLAFMSERSLTGYDNIDARSGQPDEEVFLYDAGTGRLVCASCNPTGARPHGVLYTAVSGTAVGLLVDGFKTWGGHWLAGSLPGWTDADQNRALYRSRYLSDSGRLFFDSADALVPRDANGTEDVYQYEPSGVGDCRREAGCVGLISSGTSSEESAFLDASANGNDVFFLTAARLAPQDLDSALDVYDAHVCSTAAPCLASPPAPPPSCATADACRAAASSQPGVFGAPPSATFSGAGNPIRGASQPAAKKKGLTVARKLAVALRKCRAKPKRRRASCEAHARRLYRTGVRAKGSRDAVATRKGNR
jgi:hypothetical protein